MDKINTQALEAYLEAHTTEDALLKKIERRTHLRTLKPQMLSGTVQGGMLKMISQMCAPKHVLEIGTFTGYSAICLAAGLSEGGKVHSIEYNEEILAHAQWAVREAKLEDRICLYLGKALDILPKLHNDVKFWDLIFIDADKPNYIHYYERTLPYLKSGGFILADNVLWRGRVVNPEDHAKSTKALRIFNAHVQADERVENVLLPIRDGILAIRKK